MHNILWHRVLKIRHAMADISIADITPKGPKKRSRVLKGRGSGGSPFPNFFFFFFWRDTQNSKSEKNKEKQMDHGMTVRPPVAKKKRGHYSPYAFLSLNNTTGAKITLFRRRYGIAPHVRYAVASRTNTDSLVKGMILFDQGGGGGPLFLLGLGLG